MINYEKGTTYKTPEKGGRTLEEYEDVLNINKENMEGKTILDLGSGAKEKFSKELKSSGIEADVISLNPDYAHDESLRKGVQKSSWWRKHGWQRKSVAGIGQELPFRDESFDLVLGLESVTRYVSPKDHPEETRRWSQEIIRVLKKGGEARLFPILIFDSFSLEKDKEKFNDFMEYLKSHGVEVSVEKWINESNPNIFGSRLIIKKPK